MYVVGIDEAGRGALAGPVVVASVALPSGFYPRSKLLPPLRDSKKLSKNYREEWFEFIKNHPEILFTSARVYQSVIDRRNIAKSANIAASRSLDRLFRDFDIEEQKILLDGSLYLHKKEHKALEPKTIIRGDEKFIAIKLASIVAKVVRDNYMMRVDARYPEYGFGGHKGYGTKLHFKMIKKHGPTELHRLTYLQN